MVFASHFASRHVTRFAVVVATAGLLVTACTSDDADLTASSTTPDATAPVSTEPASDGGTIATADDPAQTGSPFQTLPTAQQLCATVDVDDVAEIADVGPDEINVNEVAVANPTRTTSCGFVWESGPSSAVMFNLTAFTAAGVVVYYLDLVTNSGPGADLVGAEPDGLFAAMADQLREDTGNGPVTDIEVTGGRGVLGSVPSEKILMRPGEQVPSVVMLVGNQLFSIEVVEVGQPLETLGAAKFSDEQMTALAELVAKAFTDR